MMDPKNSKKQKTFKRLNPAGSKLDKHLLPEFIMHQAKLIQLLEHIPHVNPSFTTVPVEFMKLLKLSIGDALSFVISHRKATYCNKQKTSFKNRISNTSI